MHENIKKPARKEWQVRSSETFGWFKAVRSTDAMELLRACPAAFDLLYVIAARARWHDGFNEHNLQVGQALLGDYHNYGMTHRQYRTAVKNLSHWGFATFKPTSQGTIATLTSRTVFDCFTSAPDKSGDTPPTNGRPTPDKAPTTNEEREKRKELKSEIRSDRIEDQVLPSERTVTLRLVDKSAPYLLSDHLENSCKQLFGDIEMARNGNTWRRRIQQFPDVVEKVLGETKSAFIEGRIKTTTARFAEDYLMRLQGRK